MNQDFEERIAGERIRIELYVCESTAGTSNRARDVCERVEALAEDGTLDAVDRQTWTRKMATSSEDDDNRVERKYAEFAAWARAGDRALSPAFAKETVRNEFLDEEYETLRVPVVTVAVYADGQLVRLAPAVVGDRRYTVEDCLSELEALDEPPRQRDSALQEA